MCRIAGIANKKLTPAALQLMVKKMCQLQQHGGPDDEGFYTDEKNHLVLGHRRLALIDLSPGGHQPMYYADKRFVITYNGELYNYIELKEELKKAGYNFSTASDTEVILAAFMAYGKRAFAKFNGMFAFALYDRKEEAIYLVRDAAGIKPLYYAATDDGLAFASEVRALASVNYLNNATHCWQVYFLAYGHLPEPITTLQDVKPVPKGCFIKYTLPAEKTELEVFSYFSFVEKYESREEAIKLVQTELAASVKRHLIADAPIGVFLSGGLDSSVIALLAKKNHQSALKTLSIVFSEEKYSEKKYQDILQQSLNCNHYQHLLTKEEFDNNLSAVFKAMDLPSCDGINTWFISKAASQNNLKAVLSGIGGDELFGGYPSFNRMKTANTLAKLPSRILRAGKFANAKKIKRAVYLSIKSPVGRYLFLRGQFTPQTIAHELNIDEKQVWELLQQLPIVNSIAHQTPKNQASWIETNLYMQNQLLRDSDVMSMAHGVEIRVPFLDKEFLKLVFSISSAVKYNGENDKQLLIDSFKTELSPQIWNRPKMGFSFPFAEWMADNAMIKDAFMQNDKRQKNNYENFTNGRLHWSQLMSLLLLNKHLYET